MNSFRTAPNPDVIVFVKHTHQQTNAIQPWNRLAPKPEERKMFIASFPTLGLGDSTALLTGKEMYRSNVAQSRIMYGAIYCTPRAV